MVRSVTASGSKRYTIRYSPAMISADILSTQLRHHATGAREGTEPRGGLEQALRHELPIPWRISLNEFADLPKIFNRLLGPSNCRHPRMRRFASS